jgi:hypothetical protein
MFTKFPFFVPTVAAEHRLIFVAMAARIWELAFVELN